MIYYPHTHPGGCHFRVWAPEKKTMTLHLLPRQRDAADKRGTTDIELAMQKDADGFFHADVPDVKAGERYFYMPEGEKSYPDPASQYQPEGVHGPSEVVDQHYPWQDSHWKGLPLSELIFYEVHTGTFTPEGTFEAIITRLDEIAGLGVNAIELMPVAQNPGARNWGYDGVFPYAVQNNYGGPQGLKKLVEACHQRGIAVFLDVVYNHFGKEGNYLSQFGPYNSEKYHTPWGKALNFDGPWSDEVKNYIVRNALYWADCYHIDGLRLDAVHEIFDRNAVTIWDHLHHTLKEWQQRHGRRFYLIAESDRNDPRTLKPPALGGQGFDAQWLDDFHHALYVLLDPDGWPHYKDYGRLEQLAKAYSDGFVHSGEFVRFRHRSHGASSAGLSGEQFLVFNQNHDLPGNRPGGQRLSSLVDFPRLQLAAAALLLSPYIPLLFMGEEYGEDTPFYFFSDYGDPDVADDLKEGRKKEFAAFDWGAAPPDSQREDTFLQSKLQWDKRRKGNYAALLDWNKKLIRMRKNHPVLKDLSKKNMRVDLAGKGGLLIYRYSDDRKIHLLCLFNFSSEINHVTLPYAIEHDAAAIPWRRLLTSTDTFPAPPFSPSSSDAANAALFSLPPWGVAVYEFTSD